MMIRAAALLFCALCLPAAASPPPASRVIPSHCSGCNLAGLSLEGSDFTRNVFVGANFAGSDLRNASFKDARLVGANFEAVDLRGADFAGAECTACNFMGAKLERATFEDVLMVAANFHGFDAAGIDPAQVRALLSGCFVCNFGKGNFHGLDLSKLPLVQIDFAGADLRGVNFDGAVLCRYVVDRNQRSMACDSLQGAQTEGASFHDVRLCDDPVMQSGCTTVDPASLERATHPRPSPKTSPTTHR
jgi:uncharacterized protein YjbI with pentapeptide repeats